MPTNAQRSRDASAVEAARLQVHFILIRLEEKLSPEAGEEAAKLRRVTHADFKALRLAVREGVTFIPGGESP